MLASVLMRSIARVAVLAVLAGAIAVGVALGPGVAVAFGLGGALSSLSGIGLVGLASRLLAAPGSPGLGAGAAGTLMAVKLVAVLGVAWFLLAVWAVDGLGFVFGLGTGVLSVVIGAQLGQSSPAGQAAIRDEESRLAAAAQEGEDSEAKSR